MVRLIERRMDKNMHAGSAQGFIGESPSFNQVFELRGGCAWFRTGDCFGMKEWKRQQTLPYSRGYYRDPFLYSLQRASAFLALWMRGSMQMPRRRCAQLINIASASTQPSSQLLLVLVVSLTL